MPQLQTSRLLTHCVAAGPEDGIPVVLLHGNLSTLAIERPVHVAGGSAGGAAIAAHGYPAFFGFLASVEP